MTLTAFEEYLEGLAALHPKLLHSAERPRFFAYGADQMMKHAKELTDYTMYYMGSTITGTDNLGDHCPDTFNLLFLIATKKGNSEQEDKTIYDNCERIGSQIIAKIVDDATKDEKPQGLRYATLADKFAERVDKAVLSNNIGFQFQFKVQVKSEHANDLAAWNTNPFQDQNVSFYGQQPFDLQEEVIELNYKLLAAGGILGVDVYSFGTYIKAEIIHDGKVVASTNRNNKQTDNETSSNYGYPKTLAFDTEQGPSVDVENSQFYLHTDFADESRMVDYAADTGNNKLLFNNFPAPEPGHPNVYDIAQRVWFKYSQEHANQDLDATIRITIIDSGNGGYRYTPFEEAL